MLVTHTKKVCKYSRNSFSLEKMLTFAPCWHSSIDLNLYGRKEKV